MNNQSRNEVLKAIERCAVTGFDEQTTFVGAAVAQQRRCLRGVLTAADSLQTLANSPGAVVWLTGVAGTIARQLFDCVDSADCSIDYTVVQTVYDVMVALREAHLEESDVATALLPAINWSGIAIDYRPAASADRYAVEWHSDERWVDEGIDEEWGEPDTAGLIVGLGDNPLSALENALQQCGQLPGYILVSIAQLYWAAARYYVNQAYATAALTVR